MTREAATLRAQMNGLTVDAGNAALALEKVRVASSIKFDRATAFLSQEDVSIASQLRWTSFVHWRAIKLVLTIN